MSYVVVETLETPDALPSVNVYGPGPQDWAERKAAELDMEALPDGATERTTCSAELSEGGRSSHLGEKSLAQ